MWLKRWTPQNIVIGGAAGAFPPMIGWAAVDRAMSVVGLVLCFSSSSSGRRRTSGPGAGKLPRLRTRRRADAAGGAVPRSRRAARSCSTRSCWRRSACAPCGSSASPNAMAYAVDGVGRRAACSHFAVAIYRVPRGGCCRKKAGRICSPSRSSTSSCSSPCSWSSRASSRGCSEEMDIVTESPPKHPASSSPPEEIRSASVSAVWPSASPSLALCVIFWVVTLVKLGPGHPQPADVRRDEPDAHARSPRRSPAQRSTGGATFKVALSAVAVRLPPCSAPPIAAVPLYRSLLSASRASAARRMRAEVAPADRVIDHTVDYPHLDANIGPGLPWRFRGRYRPPHDEGGRDRHTMTYQVTNTVESSRSAGTATYNVAPTPKPGASSTSSSASASTELKVGATARRAKFTVVYLRRSGARR
jgi:hypothetical protein